jgi:hypothetical protein
LTELVRLDEPDLQCSSVGLLLLLHKIQQKNIHTGIRFVIHHFAK